jgi:general secretion pathway protein M
MNRSQLVSWYQGLAPRDQRILRLGGIAALLLLCVALILPMQRNLWAARSRVKTKQTDLTWMRSVAPTLAAAGPMASAPETQESLVVLVDRSARESGLGQALTGSQPSGKGALRVQVEKAEFNLLVAWLARLSNQHGITVESATVDGLGESGQVNAAVVLRTR